MELLALEKAHTREYDRINAIRRRLPMVRVERDYRFVGEDGERSLPDLFEGKSQLIVYHFMFEPEWDKGCPGCTGLIDAIRDLSLLDKKSARFVMVSRAPLKKLLAYRKEKGWEWPWYSAVGNDFNFDLQVTVAPGREGQTYNYFDQDRFAKEFSDLDREMDLPGTSVFLRTPEGVFHTYSTFQRGGEALTDSYRLLDITPYGRQEDFEDSPEGWPQEPTYG